MCHSSPPFIFGSSAFGFLLASSTADTICWSTCRFSTACRAATEAVHLHGTRKCCLPIRTGCAGSVCRGVVFGGGYAVLWKPSIFSGLANVVYPSALGARDRFVEAKILAEAPSSTCNARCFLSLSGRTSSTADLRYRCRCLVVQFTVGFLFAWTRAPSHLATGTAASHVSPVTCCGIFSCLRSPRAVAIYWVPEQPDASL